MNIFKEYKEYLSDNPQGYWFKRKLYGWGWTPVRWQGWVVMLIFILFIIWNGMQLGKIPIPTDNEIIWFFAKTILAVLAIILVCYKTGEKPKWQWGLPKK